jgi:alkyl hydroperoxide reductase subunit AhpC
MEAYRDQYATLFNNGRNVVVLGVSLDADTTLISWFRELDTPIMVMGDGDKKVSTLYQALNAAGTADQRHLYVIDKTGKVTYKTLPFRVMAQDAYTELEAEIDKLNPPPTPPGGTLR